MKLATDTKILSIKESLIFLIISIALTWSWTTISSILDKGNDKGLITIVGFIILTSLIISLFFSKNKILDSIKLILQFSFLSILIFVLIFTVGIRFSDIERLEWIGYLIPLIILGSSLFIIIRQVVYFPNNKIAFGTLLIAPTISLLLLNSFPLYTNQIKFDFGYGVPIGIILTITFIIVGIMGRAK